MAREIPRSSFPEDPDLFSLPDSQNSTTLISNQSFKFKLSNLKVFNNYLLSLDFTGYVNVIAFGNYTIFLRVGLHTYLPSFCLSFFLC